MSRLVFFTGAMTASRSSALTSGDSSMTTILARLPRMVPTEKLSIFEPFFNVQMLNSLFIADYRNSRHIDPHVVCDFFDGFLEDAEARMEEEIPGFNDAHFFDHLPKYDNPDTLWDYYCSIEFDLSEYIPEVEEAA